MYIYGVTTIKVGFSAQHNIMVPFLSLQKTKFPLLEIYTNLHHTIKWKMIIYIYFYLNLIECKIRLQNRVLKRIFWSCQKKTTIPVFE